MRTLDRRAGEVCRDIWDGRELAFPQMIQCPEMVNESFDVVMVDGIWLFTDEPWAEISIPKATTWGDNHGDLVAKYIQEAHNKLDLFFPMLWESFERFHGETFQGKHAEWLPWAFNPDIFHDYGEAKDINVFSSGVLNSEIKEDQVYTRKGNMVYPLRTKLHQLGAPYPSAKPSERVLRRGRDGFCHAYRPPEDESADYWPVGEDYARLINSAWMCASCSSVHRYALGKTFEIPAARSVLLSDLCEDAKGLGLVAGESMAAIPPELSESEEDLRAFVADLLDDPADLERIADNGYRLMHERHTVDVRAAHFVERLRCLI